jgi:hypothetical protein
LTKSTRHNETVHRATKVRALEKYRLEVEFEDGVAGIVDLGDRLFGPVFEPLRDSEYFRRVGIDEFGVVCWPNGADLAPDNLYRSLAAEGVEGPAGRPKTLADAR